MLEKYPDYINNNYIGGLFDGPYPVFENNQCVQYIQEYLPFHLPRIETALRKVLLYFGKELLYQNRPIRILDLGSGPATVPLAFCRQLDRYNYPSILNITTLEASNTFNKMIDIFNEINSNNNITINRLHDTFDNFIINAKNSKGQFDWIIISNFITGIASTVDDVKNILKDMFNNLMNVDQPLFFTFIEPNKRLINKFWREASFCTNNISEEVIHTLKSSLNFNEIMICKFYRHKYPDHHKPYIITKTMRLMLT